MFFKRQQRAVGSTNGYIEEMIEGQKAVKVFCHEEDVKDCFAELNDTLRQASTNANTYANIIMPIMVNLSYVNYALTAATGAMLVISGRMDIGSIASFLQYTRSFSQPITQISQQFNAILAALAGAERIFEIIDEEPEVDAGDVSLVYAEVNADDVPYRKARAIRESGHGSVLLQTAAAVHAAERRREVCRRVFRI